jgi:hypothetical protein
MILAKRQVLENVSSGIVVHARIYRMQQLSLSLRLDVFPVDAKNVEDE